MASLVPLAAIVAMSAAEFRRPRLKRILFRNLRGGVRSDEEIDSDKFNLPNSDENAEYLQVEGTGMLYFEEASSVRDLPWICLNLILQGPHHNEHSLQQIIWALKDANSLIHSGPKREMNTTHINATDFSVFKAAIEHCNCHIFTEVKCLYCSNHRKDVIEKLDGISAVLMRRGPEMITFRKLEGVWWKLDPFLYPEAILPMKVLPRLNEHLDDGFTCFVVVGQLPFASMREVRRATQKYMNVSSIFSAQGFPLSLLRPNHVDSLEVCRTVTENYVIRDLSKHLAVIEGSPEANRDTIGSRDYPYSARGSHDAYDDDEFEGLTSEEELDEHEY